MAELIFYGIVLIVLAGLNVFQFVFFSRELQTLVDKVMSRDFAEYRKVKESKPAKSTSPRMENEIFEERPPEGFVF